MKKTVDEGYTLEEYKNYTSFIYGEQTWGSLFAEGEGKQIPFTDNSATPYILQSLKILKITKPALRKLHILNIGSGRETRVFHRMGAGRVTHLDISQRNIQNTERYIQQDTPLPLAPHI